MSKPIPNDDDLASVQRAPSAPGQGLSYTLTVRSRCAPQVVVRWHGFGSAQAAWRVAALARNELAGLRAAALEASHV